MDILSRIYSAAAQFISLIRISDIIDVAIVAFVFYKCAKLIRETRAVQLIKGIIVLICATQISHWLEFNAMSYLLRNAMQVGVFALIVVFQPELRRALEKVGQSSIGNFFTTEVESIDDVIDEVVRAAGELSKQRIGALIVFERTTKLGEIIQMGTSIEALVTAELLINIFIPNTPLHDGAVIIRGNRIKSAGCLLPLTHNQNLSKELGTRHRAALGMSESSDSVVVVISEETGKISFALDGNLTRNLTPETLKKALIKTLRPGGIKKHERLRRWKEGFKWPK